MLQEYYNFLAYCLYSQVTQKSTSALKNIIWLELRVAKFTSVSLPLRKIRLIESTAKCRHLKNLPVKRLCGSRLSVWGPIPPPPPTLYTVYVHIVYLFTQGRLEVGECCTREKYRGATVYKAGSKIPTWLTVSQVYNTPAAKSLYRSIFLDDDNLLCCL